MSDELNPYKSPVEISSDSYTPLPRTSSLAPCLEGYQSGHVRSVVARTLLTLILLTALFRIGFMGYLINLLDRIESGGNFSIEETQLADAIEKMLGITWLVLWIISAITFITWSYRAYQNLRPLGNWNLQYSTGWTIGSWFVPFLNLYYPYVIHAEIWQGSDPAPIRDRSGLVTKTSSLVGWWWASYLTMNVIAYGQRHLSNDSTTSAFLQCGVSIFADFFAIPAAILAMLLIKKIDRNQEERYQLLLQQPAESRSPQTLGDGLIRLL
jgi:hypothetical protein